MINPENPIATPFRTQAATDPRVEYRFSTGVITSANGREQRHPRTTYPRMSVRWECAAMSPQHVSRIESMERQLSLTAIAVRDYRMNASGRVSIDGWSVTLDRWTASWAADVRIVIEDQAGMIEHTTRIASADAASRRIVLTERAPFGMRNTWVGVGSAIVASLDGEQTVTRWHNGVASWGLSAKSFYGLDRIGGAHTDVFPLRHGSRDAIRITTGRNVWSTEFGLGRREESYGYGSLASGLRTYQVEAFQMSQDAKEELISFFCGCRGQLRSFSAPNLIQGARFRFGSDVLNVVHTSGETSNAGLSVVQVLQ